MGRKKKNLDIKIPKAVQLKSGNWYIQLRLNGVSVPITRSTEKECEEEARKIKIAHKLKINEIKPQKETPTLTAAIDAYIAKRSDSKNDDYTTLSPSTITGYRRIQAGRFQKYMNTPIGKLTDWQAICNEEAKEKIHHNPNNKPVSPKTLKNAYFFIKSVYKENGIILPDVQFKTAEKKTRSWLDPDEIETLVKSVAGKHEQLPVLFALHSLRRSELLALDWKNIELNDSWENSRFHVKGAVVKDEHNNFVKKDANKNYSSQRTIRIMIPALYDALVSVPKDERKGNVITINGNSVLYEINKACRDAGVPEVGTHGLRHSYASLAYHLGMSELETMEIGGWSDPNTMREIYTHLAEKDRQKAMNKMAAFYSKTT